MSLLEFCQWLETTAVARLVTESQWGFQILVAAHLLGLTLSVGMIIWFDLRLLGRTMTAVPVSVVYRRIAPWALSGFAVMFVSGVMLFAGYATAAYGNVFFRIKLIALALAFLNAAAYHLHTERRIVAWDVGAATPWAARAAGLISLAVWLTVIIAGRSMSYTMF
jgi:hypothetical protein